MTTAANDTPTPSLKGRLIALFLGLVLLLGLSEIVLRVAMPNWRDFYSGWFMTAEYVPGYTRVATGIAGFDGYFAQNNGDFRVRIGINKFGLRNKDPIDNADGRIWVVGDSMTFGWGVEENQRYSELLGKNLGQPTYNIASPGTDVCGYQSLLARMPKTVKPKAVVMGLILENDITDYDCKALSKRHTQQFNDGYTQQTGASGLLEFKRFLTANTAIYNFIAVSLKRVDVVRTVLTSLKIIKPTLTYKNPLQGKKFDRSVNATVREILVFNSMLPTGTPFTVLIAPGRFELKNGDTLYKKLRLGVMSRLEQAGITAIDPFRDFNQAGYAPTHFAHDGHWTPLGHEIAANSLVPVLKAQLLAKE